MIVPYASAFLAQFLLFDFLLFYGRDYFMHN